MPHAGRDRGGGAGGAPARSAAGGRAPDAALGGPARRARDLGNRATGAAGRRTSQGERHRPEHRRHTGGRRSQLSHRAHPAHHRPGRSVGCQHRRPRIEPDRADRHRPLPGTGRAGGAHPAGRRRRAPLHLRLRRRHPPGGHPRRAGLGAAGLGNRPYRRGRRRRRAGRHHPDRHPVHDDSAAGGGPRRRQRLARLPGDGPARRQPHPHGYGSPALPADPAVAGAVAGGPGPMAGTGRRAGSAGPDRLDDARLHGRSFDGPSR